jgi:hypothetical protein
VIVAVKVGESLEICGRPGVFPLEELVDFALRGRASVYRCCVGIFRFSDPLTGCSESFLCSSEELMIREKELEVQIILKTHLAIVYLS